MSQHTAHGRTRHRLWLCLLVILPALGLLALCLPGAARSAPGRGQPEGGEIAPARTPAADALFSTTVQDDYICTRDVVLRTPRRCPPYGPGTREVRIAYLRSLLPDPLPVLATERIPQVEGSVTRYVYGHITNLPASTYRHPAEAGAGLPPVRTFQANINWVSVIGTVDVNGQSWVQINADEYIQAGHIAYPEASRFQGAAFAEQPTYPFAWLRRDLQPSPAPGEPPLPDLTLPHRALVTVFATERVGDQRWDMIGPDQWVDHDWVAQVTPTMPPDGVPAGIKWLDVDTYEQTLAAYEGDRLVYATLITAGKSDLTPLGTFRIFRKVRAALMESYDRPMDDPYWFYLEDVEHAQFFNDRISLHAAYWHDYFGTSRSNGCVNLAPLDASWLYDWTDPQLPSGGSWATAESAGEGSTWVWVHDSAPGQARKPRP